MTSSSNPMAPPRPTALITGASAGIGHDLAHVFAQHQHDLVLTARDRNRLEELSSQLHMQNGVTVHVLPADLADPIAPQRLLDAVRERSIAVDVLVNNAGFGTHGPFSQSELAAQLSMIQVNVTALVHLTRVFLPGMLERRAGKILNVGSMAGFMPGPFMSTYYATKAFVMSHSMALSRELRGSGVSVTVLCPGPTRTEFKERAGMRDANLFKMRSMDSMTVARAGFIGLMRGQRIVVPGASNKLVAFASRMLPRGTMARIAGKLNKNR